MPALRPVITRRSAVLLTYLSRRPKPLLPALCAALLLAGLTVPAALGVPLLLALLVLLGWLVYLSWPVLVTPARIVRISVLALLSAALLHRLID